MVNTISIIMPSFLGDYSEQVGNVTVKSARDREKKLHRAIKSFIDNEYQQKELIIVSDGCDRTTEIAKSYIYSYPVENIINLQIPKQKLFSGKVRQAGIETANGRIIAYLDSDDFFGKDHIENLAKFDTEMFGWVYFNDRIQTGEDDDDYYIRNVVIKHGSIGTSSFAHKKSVDLVWQDGYGHDWFTINKYLLDKTFTKIENCQYHVCHVSGIGIDV